MIAQVRVVSPNADTQIGAFATDGITEEDMHKIASVIDSISQAVIATLEKDQEEAKPHMITLDELKIAFGIDIAAEAKIPIISQLTGTSMKAGATFQVSITFKNK